MKFITAACLTLLLALPLAIFTIRQVNASLSACGGYVNPANVAPNSTNTFTLTVTNQSSSDIVWVKLTRPSDNFTILSHSIQGWSVDLSASQIILTGGSIPQGGASTFEFSVSTNGNESDATAWQVQASDDSQGASSLACLGSFSTSIFSNPSAPNLSNISVRDVTTTSAKVSWETDTSSNSQIQYGTNDSYGLTKSDSSASTQHSLSIDGLSNNTVYHYKISSTNNLGTSESDDSTFSTALEAQSSSLTTTSQTTNQTSTQPSPKPTPKSFSDNNPPVISTDFDFSKPYPSPPKISGKASDNSSIAKIGYSLDGGKNWLPVDNIKSPNSASSLFDFTPAFLEDNNYQVQLRAQDQSGNIGYSKVFTLIIDRLPPLVGGSVSSIGPEILEGSENGVLFALEGLDQKITLSAVGGPTQIDLASTKNGEAKNRSTFSLIKDPDSGLWSGTLSFSSAGVYQITANSADGAKNKTSRDLNTVVVLKDGQIKFGDQPVKDAIVTVFYLEPSTKQFVVWDGQSFSQNNPQKTDQEGRYRLLLPAGDYYLQIQALGFKKLITNIFESRTDLPINTTFQLQKSAFFQIGPLVIPLPDFSLSQTDINLSSPQIPDKLSVKNQISGQTLANFSLYDELGKTVNTTSLRGKPTIITILNTWLPQSSSQLTILNELRSKQEINSVVVFPGERSSTLNIFKKRGGYQLNLLADPDGKTISPLNVLTLPMHLFLDRKGVVTKLKIGILKKDELLSNLIQ